MTIRNPGLAAAFALLLAAASAGAAEVPATYPEAMRWYERAAQDGVADAQFLLGRMLETGRLRARDPAAAARWYGKAAAQGHLLAQFRLGTMYETGFGVARDPTAAAGWYAKAAAQGLADAQYNLARLYETGVGVAADKARALALYRQAAAHGLGRAQLNLGLLLRDNAANPETRIEAALWLSRAADADVAGAAAARDDLLAGLSADDRAEFERRKTAPR